MNYCKLHRIFCIGALSFLFAFSALAAESRLQLEARKMEMSGDYTGAIELYKKDMARKGDNAVSLLGIARCYFTMGNFEQAENFYAQLVEKDAKPAYNLAYAQVLLHNNKREEAAEKAKEAMTDEELAEKAKVLAAACDSALLWESEQPSYEARNLAELNTCYSDWGALLRNPHEIIFFSDRPTEEPDCDGVRPSGASIAGGFSAHGAENDEEVTEWSSVQAMPYPFNQKGVQVGPMVIAPNDSTEVYFTRTSGKGVTKSKKVGREVVRENIENLEIYSAR
jgi:tetratricopeptide (TPR) repeat protein